MGYVLDKPLPTALPEGSSPEERVTFDKWLEDNRKVRSIILASMTNEIQKQYDRLEDVPSIMLRMKDVYAVPDRHIRYAAIKAFFGTKMAEGSSVQSHGVTMLSLVEKLEDLKAGLDNDTYINERLQPPKAKGKGARRWKRKKGKGTAVTATASTGVLLLLPRRERAKERLGVLSSQRQMMCAFIAWKGHWKRECPQLLSHPGMFVVEINMISNSASWVLDTGCGAHICNDLQVLQRSRKLSKDEMILRLGKDDQKPFVTKCDRQRLEVENQTSRKIKALRSDRGGEYLSGEFIDYLKENGILSQWTPPGTPQLNGVAERRNRTLLDMVRSMMSFMELPRPFGVMHLRRQLSCLTYCHLSQYPRRHMRYGMASLPPTMFLEKDFSSDNQRDEVLIEESSGEPPHYSTASFEPTVHTDGVPILRRSTRESRVPERYGFVGLTSQLDNDPKTYGKRCRTSIRTSG
ncbi:UNVERIFIED_CONTAM: hypothetical protein Slati_1373300 [Sesamum latifolium]|uniref:Integrase catalytic domain-containing protein n=1 Tax=Sesamum latifolium TaxID=2727402 RepID=A0AAW2XIW5_9LAMI